ncbi:hypothetical protein AAGG74_17205 [Bacillus mexicanus]|uniref:hypothetical protein n=1 Tax=Bacillus mexicanus TaxID=2834415 RepID=UPI003D1B3753
MEQQIKRMYQASKRLKGDRKIEHLECLLKNCLNNNNQVLYEYLVRLELVNEYKDTGSIKKAIKHYLECLEIQSSEEFNVKPLFNLFPFIAKHIDSILDINLNEINNFFERMQRLFELHSNSLRCYYQEYYNYLMRVGKWEEGFVTYSKWMVESRSGYSESIGEEEADRAFYYFSVGDYQNGKYVFDTVKKGIESSPGTRAYAYPKAIRYFLELRDWEMTNILTQQGYSFCKDKIDRLEGVADILKTLSILNPKKAIKLWKHHRYDFLKTDNSRAKFSFGISAFILNKVFKLYSNDEVIQNKFNENIKEMYDIQSLMDNRNNNEAYQDELMYWVEIQDALYKEKSSL